MSQQDATGAGQIPGQASGQLKDERLKEASFILRLMRRPELGAVMGLVIVIVFFIMVANATMFELSGIMNFMAPA
nr:ABC transporter permease [Pseudomonadota bacterium]